jgi:hypothetical protein
MSQKAPQIFDSGPAIQKAQKLLRAALDRHPPHSDFVQKDFTRVRKFLEYVFGKDINDGKQRCFRDLDHKILPAVGLLLKKRELEESNVATIHAFCSEVSKSIGLLGWLERPELWEPCLGIVSSRDIYLNFRKSMSPSFV